ncbi:MAG: hypothetical protein AAF511_06120 [Pseudomonadota bacterium]
MLRLFCILLFLMPTPASAVIISGQMTGGNAFTRGGSFVEILSLDGLTITADGFDDFNLRAFNERQNVVADSIIETDIGRDVAAGEMVASHYVFFDPVSVAQAVGTIYFDAPIIGVMTRTRAVHGSSDYRHTDVTYDHSGAWGLESSDHVTLYSDEPHRLDVAFWANRPGDFIRVFTEFSQGAVDLGISEYSTPVPSSGVLILTGFLGWGFAQRARAVRR